MVRLAPAFTGLGDSVEATGNTTVKSVSDSTNMGSASPFEIMILPDCASSGTVTSSYLLPVTQKVLTVFFEGKVTDFIRLEISTRNGHFVSRLTDAG